MTNQFLLRARGRQIPDGGRSHGRLGTARIHHFRGRESVAAESPRLLLSESSGGVVASVAAFNSVMTLRVDGEGTDLAVFDGSVSSISASGDLLVVSAVPDMGAELATLELRRPLAAGERLGRLREAEDVFATFLSASEELLSAGGTRLRLFSLERLEEPVWATAAGDPVLAVCGGAAGGGRTVIAGHRSGAVRMWDGRSKPGRPDSLILDANFDGSTGPVACAGLETLERNFVVARFFDGRVAVGDSRFRQRSSAAKRRKRDDNSSGAVAAFKCETSPTRGAAGMAVDRKTNTVAVAESGQTVALFDALSGPDAVRRISCSICSKPNSDNGKTAPRNCTAIAALPELPTGIGKVRFEEESGLPMELLVDSGTPVARGPFSGSLFSGSGPAYAKALLRAAMARRTWRSPVFVTVSDSAQWHAVV